MCDVTSNVIYWTIWLWHACILSLSTFTFAITWLVNVISLLWFSLLSLCNYNSVTRNYFENLVRALENGLSDVDSNGACSKTSTKNVGGSSKGRGGRGKGTTRAGGSSKSGDDTLYWSCEQCTYANVKSATRCEMCNQQRRWKI